MGLAAFARGLSLTGNVQTDVVAWLTSHGRAKTGEHSLRVAGEAGRLAWIWGEDESSAEMAGWLHDVSAIVPPDQRIRLAENLQIEVLPEERIAPVLIHQKLSAAIARDLFGIANLAILSAIGCHTTLKANASSLDKILFIADKLKWDRPGDPPYLIPMAAAAERSLDAAALCYLEHLWQNRETLPALHSWALDAYHQLAQRGYTGLKAFGG